MIGTTLAHFKITGKLGEGGMGEVYRAEDTKLGREVAIKVLPEMVAVDEERLARFEREAKLLASLNHPNIGAIYSLESEESKKFLVLELIEGETLGEVLARGPLPIERALGIGQQIAVALEAAHAKGVIHRDLKPANVKLTPDGKAKVLDFGLAKAWDVEESSGSSPLISRSPTLTQGMTEGAPAAAVCSSKMCFWVGVQPVPPCSTGQFGATQPRSNSLRCQRALSVRGMLIPAAAPDRNSSLSSAARKASTSSRKARSWAFKSSCMLVSSLQPVVFERPQGLSTAR